MSNDQKETNTQIALEEILQAIKALPTRERLHLLAEACEQMAWKLGPKQPAADATESMKHAYYRFLTIQSEAGYDSTMWGEDMEELYAEKPMTSREEIISALFGVGRNVRDNVRHLNRG